MPAKIAVIQKPPVLLDRDGTIGKAIEAIDEAADAGASLLVFPEAWIPGYPTWVWRLKPGADMALSGELHARLRQNAVDIERGDLQPLQDAARRRGVTVVVGLHEIDSRFSGTTLFNTVVVVGPDGMVLNRHRKLMPTNGLGHGRCERPESRRYAGRPARVPDLLGAAGTLRAICTGHQHSGQSNLGQRRGVPRHAPPHRPRGRLLGGRNRNRDAGQRRDRDRLFKPEEWINDGDAVVIKPSGNINRAL